jgi:hypothetical protein
VYHVPIPTLPCSFFSFSCCFRRPNPWDHDE